VPANARVLIAEDEPNILTVLAFLMRRSGFETRLAADGEEALALLSTFRPHLLLLDVMLPQRSGLDVCRALRADPALAGTRVLMLTAKGGAKDIEAGMAAGADDYLTKPFSTQDLVGTVMRLLALPRPAGAGGEAGKGEGA
jgi:DNA-binding response OmpR family regulator